MDYKALWLEYTQTSEYYSKLSKSNMIKFLTKRIDKTMKKQFDSKHMYDKNISNIISEYSYKQPSRLNIDDFLDSGYAEIDVDLPGYEYLSEETKRYLRETDGHENTYINEVINAFIKPYIDITYYCFTVKYDHDENFMIKLHLLPKTIADSKTNEYIDFLWTVEDDVEEGRVYIKINTADKEFKREFTHDWRSNRGYFSVLNENIKDKLDIVKKYRPVYVHKQKKLTKKIDKTMQEQFDSKHMYDKNISGIISSYANEFAFSRKNRRTKIRKESKEKTDFYCMKCKKKVNSEIERVSKIKNRKLARGKCSKCKSNICVFIK
jgi:hypothetical protein